MQGRMLVMGAVCVLGLASLVALGQRPGVVIRGEAPLDAVVDFPKEQLAAFFAEMHADSIVTMRLLEGGEYNVNIRHVENITPDNMNLLTHPDTIDVWVVTEGSGTLLTGATREGDRYVGGEERFVDVGDLVFIPAGISHGMKQTDLITWLNIRFPEHRN